MRGDLFAGAAIGIFTLFLFLGERFFPLRGRSAHCSVATSGQPEFVAVAYATVALTVRQALGWTQRSYCRYRSSSPLSALFLPSC